MESTEELKQQYKQYLVDVETTVDRLVKALGATDPLTGYTALVNVAALVLLDAQGRTRRQMAKMMLEVVAKAKEAEENATDAA